eukprot:scpid27994/ scgid16400/ Retinoblastoma-binding protein 5
MNLELLAKSFGKTYPEDNDGTLDCGSVALTCSFNRFGTLLAVGCNDGRIAIWDLMTRCVSKSFSGHVHPITQLSWTRDGHHLASASLDWNVSIWHILSGECVTTYSMLSPPAGLVWHPKGEPRLLVCPMKHAPILIHTDTKEQFTLPIDGESEQNTVGCFDRVGQHIYIGSSRGKILIIDEASREIVKKFRVTTSSNTATSIKSIHHARRGSLFLINSSDRVVRIYDTEMILSEECDVEEPDALQKMQDLVNRTSWKKCCFSGDGEYVAAGCSRQNVINIWQSKSGNLVKILQGLQGEVLVDAAWHPVRPIIASVSGGVVTVWSHTQAENWSSFAPDFRELEENEEYDEHESEFDDEDEDKSDDGEDAGNLDEESDVDVTTVEKVPAYCSSDEEDGVETKKAKTDTSKTPDLLYIPVTPEIDEPEEGGWGQLEIPIINVKRKRPSADGVDTTPQKKKTKGREAVVTQTATATATATTAETASTRDEPAEKEQAASSSNGSSQEVVLSSATERSAEASHCERNLPVPQATAPGEATTTPASPANTTPSSPKPEDTETETALAVAESS